MSDKNQVKNIEADDKSSRLELYKLIVTLVASILIPLMIFIVGKSIEKSLKDRELALKYVEISVGILTESPAPETKNLRDWAIKNINKYAEIELNENVIKELKTESLPVAESISKSSRNYTVPSSPRDIKYLVISDSENPSLNSLKNMMKKGDVRASYHYIIGTDGSVEQIVDEENIAWHAGRSNWKGETNLNSVSIGIGLVHLSSSNGENWLNLDKEHPAIGPSYPPAQIAALVNLLATLTKRHELPLESILTKQDIAPNRRRTDLQGESMETVKDRLRTLGAR